MHDVSVSTSRCQQQGEPASLYANDPGYV